MANNGNTWLLRIVAGVMIALSSAAVIGSVAASGQTSVNDTRLLRLECERTELRAEIAALRECLDDRLRAVEQQLAAVSAQIDAMTRSER